MTIARIFKCRNGVVLAAVLSFSVTASVPHLTTAERIGRYDFSYAVQASPRVRPVQVFDDGHNTYFQFLGGDAVPAIFKVSDQGPELTTQAFEGPYLRVEGIGAEFLLKLGSSTGRVHYTAPGRTPVMSQQVFTAAQTPSWSAQVASLQAVALTPSDARPKAIETNSYATPVKGDVTKWEPTRVEDEEYELLFGANQGKLTRQHQTMLTKLANEAHGDYTVIVIGRDDDAFKDGVADERARQIADFLVTKGVQKSRIDMRTGGRKKVGDNWASTVRLQKRAVAEVTVAVAQPAAMQVAPPKPTGPQLEAPTTGFTFLQSDQTIGGAVRRWAAETQYQLVWEVPRDADPAITGNGRLRATNMREAMELVSAGLRSKGYAMEITMYRNRVIKVSPSSI